MKRFACILLCLLLFGSITVQAEDGYRLWLRYDPIDDPLLLQQYRQAIGPCYFPVAGSDTRLAARNELIGSRHRPPRPNSGLRQ